MIVVKKEIANAENLTKVEVEVGVEVEVEVEVSAAVATAGVSVRGNPLFALRSCTRVRASACAWPSRSRPWVS